MEKVEETIVNEEDTSDSLEDKKKVSEEKRNNEDLEALINYFRYK